MHAGGAESTLLSAVGDGVRPVSVVGFASASLALFAGRQGVVFKLLGFAAVVIKGAADPVVGLQAARRFVRVVDDPRMDLVAFVAAIATVLVVGLVGRGDQLGVGHLALAKAAVAVVRGVLRIIGPQGSIAVLVFVDHVEIALEGGGTLFGMVVDLSIAVLVAHGRAEFVLSQGSAGLVGLRGKAGLAGAPFSAFAHPFAQAAVALGRKGAKLVVLVDALTVFVLQVHLAVAIFIDTLFVATFGLGFDFVFASLPGTAFANLESELTGSDLAGSAATGCLIIRACAALVGDGVAGRIVAGKIATVLGLGSDRVLARAPLATFTALMAFFAVSLGNTTGKLEWGAVRIFTAFAEFSVIAVGRCVRAGFAHRRGRSGAAGRCTRGQGGAAFTGLGCRVLLEGTRRCVGGGRASRGE